MEIITRQQAVKKLKKIIGVDLRMLADNLGVTVFKDGKLNKGWAGHTLERFMGLCINSKQAPNGEFWELKLVPVVRKESTYTLKETMAITMINSTHVIETEFIESHLYHKLKSIIICCRSFEGRNEQSARLISVGTFDLVEKELLNQVKKDYELVQKVIKEAGFNALSGRMGVLVQPRTKGSGHGSTTRAFYARKGFVEIITSLKNVKVPLKTKPVRQ